MVSNPNMYLDTIKSDINSHFVQICRYEDKEKQWVDHLESPPTNADDDDITSDELISLRFVARSFFSSARIPPLIAALQDFGVDLEEDLDVVLEEHHFFALVKIVKSAITQLGLEIDAYTVA
ncbi:hypothetical protein BGX29_007647 [Mortierella sp. GBA35]|nr:hypothetical protein BGX29_007647 [Mortierella sp. GBA35]